MTTVEYGALPIVAALWADDVLVGTLAARQPMSRSAMIALTLAVLWLGARLMHALWRYTVDRDR